MELDALTHLSKTTTHVIHCAASVSLMPLMKSRSMQTFWAVAMLYPSPLARI